MKKKLIMMSMLMFILLPLHAQLTVTKAGQSVFGKHMRKGTTLPVNPIFPTNSNDLQSTTSDAIIIPSQPYVTLDSLATAVFLGKDTDNRGGYITFGGNKNVWVGEYNNTVPAILQLGGISGIFCTTRNGTLFSHRTTSTTSSPFRFYTDVRANSFVVDSDSRIKTNVKDLDEVSEQLCGLSPISYTLATQSAAESTEIMNDQVDMTLAKIDAPAPPSGRTRYGFMAQEVKEIFPELVIEDEDGTLGIDYIGFIPILVNAVKDLNTLVAEQQKEIDALSGNYKRKSKVDGSSAAIDRVSEEICGMEQNKPNPFSLTTIINCMIPDSMETADLYVYDLQGSQKLHIPITERGTTTVSIEATSLTPGMYIYMLVADGVEIDSKRMIVTE